MKRTLTFAFLLLSLTIYSFAQQPTLTTADYARAEKMLGFNTAPYVDRAAARPTFLPDGRFWYRVLTPTGSEYVMVNPADGLKKSGLTLESIGIAQPPKKALTKEEEALLKIEDAFLRISIDRKSVV